MGEKHRAAAAHKIASPEGIAVGVFWQDATPSGLCGRKQMLPNAHTKDKWQKGDCKTNKCTKISQEKKITEKNYKIQKNIKILKNFFQKNQKWTFINVQNPNFQKNV